MFILLTSIIIKMLFSHKINMKLFIIGLIGFFMISLMRYYRQLFIFGDSYLTSLKDVWYFGENLLFIYPGYVTLTMNYSVFENLVKTFGYGDQNYQYGYNLFLPFIAPLWPGKQETLGDLQNELWNTGFDYNLTSTIIGIPYVDFGVLGCALIMFIFGALLRISLNLFLSSRSITIAFIYAQLVSFIVFSFYSYPLTGLHSFVYPLITFLLFHFFIKRAEIQ